ncbi:MAG: hypothetical protein JNJ54_12115 [Myxococcaceae bacterium]|nr:hypothetical protein [Myxococcaceae bacterium]
MTPLSCPSCGASYRTSDIDRTLAIASCHACGAVMDLKTRTPADESRLDALTRPAPPPALPLPEKFTVAETPGRLEVTWRWFSAVHVFLFFFALFWNGFLVLWFGIALAQGELVMALFGSLHAAVGIGLAYSVLTGFVNRTRIALEHGVLTVKHGPLPWPGSGEWKREDLAQLYGEQHVSRGKNGTTTTWSLNAMLRDGRRVKLLKGLTERAQALWLERTLEGRMSIVDAPVVGEMEK